jgi:hypothetical protein
MGLFKESDLRNRAERSATLQKSAGTILNEKAQAAAALERFNIFLSHSFHDHKLILGARLTLEEIGYNVYVDWIHGRQLSRDNVTKETAAILRSRMRKSRSLLFATTANSSESIWMPWELGYMDGYRGRTAILPVSQSDRDSYQGQEYLGIYPYASKDPMKGEKRDRLWINTSTTCYVSFEQWVEGREPYER